ncbi:UNVERIFIED_CONTAM: hypothetical protein K2H54_057656 [Gekko kuhli]
MNPNDLLIALGDFSVDMVGAPVDVLVDFWNKEMTWAVDMLIPRGFKNVAAAQGPKLSAAEYFQFSVSEKEKVLMFIKKLHGFGQAKD